MIDLEGGVTRAIMDAAHAVGGMRPRKNISGSYGHAVTRLLERARVFSVKSDEQWAAEVAFLKDAIKEALELMDPRADGAWGLKKALEEHDGDA